ncbi:MAG: aldehyde dehydrogenase family protein [Candidatus Sulfotelmatobacter sp.]
MYVGGGLLQLMDSEDELAAVMGHEIEHIDHYHCAERVQQEEALRRLPLGGLVALPVELFEAGYSKDQELEADREGTRLAVQAGYSANGAIRMFETFDRLHNEYQARAKTPQEESYKDMDAAIREVKKHPKPLSGFLFSRDQKAIDHFLASLSFGGSAINQVNIHLFIETMPFGGVGYSGIGHYYGKAGFDALTHAKSVFISPPDVAIEHLFPPYTEERVKALSQWFEY